MFVVCQEDTAPVGTKVDLNIIYNDFVLSLLYFKYNKIIINNHVKFNSTTTILTTLIMDSLL